MSTREAVEQLEVQLAGCLVAAEGGAVGKNDATPGMYGYSEAFRVVKALYHEKERLRALLNELLNHEQRGYGKWTRGMLHRVEDAVRG